MTPSEYLLALVSILVGLAVADLAMSLHRLLRARRRVRWDWLPMVAALFVANHILGFWWALYGLLQLDVWMISWAFLVLAAFLISLFLLASAALPDAVPAEGLDLRAYYDENRRYFWTLFALLTLLGTAVLFVHGFERTNPTRLAIAAVPNLVSIAIFLSLGFVRSRRYHAVIVPLMLVSQGWALLQFRLG